MTQLTLINGQPQDRVDSHDRGLTYGHGVFETLLLTRGRLQFLDWHLERLLDGCSRLLIPTDALAETLQRELSGLPHHQDAVVKVMVTAGTGGRGYALPRPVRPGRIVQLSPLPSWPDAPAEGGIRARWCHTRLARQPSLAGIKHLNRLEQVLARAEWQDTSVREGILLDTAGYVVEGTMSNLFWVQGNTIHTPALDACGVAGILRRWVLSVAGSVGLELRVDSYYPQVLEDADEVFVCNSLAGLWPVVQLGSRTYVPGPVTRTLQALLNKEYDPC